MKSITETTNRVRVYELVQPEDWELPPFASGAHIDVHIPGGFVRQYSLAADPADRHRYRIGVLSRPDGSGGSIALRDNVRVGSEVSVSLPKNYFPLANLAEKHIFIAGGIGITPFLSMIPVVQRRGQPFELHMCSPTKSQTPFFEELARLNSGGTVHFYHDGDARPTPLRVESLLNNRAENEHVYCCGPTGLMDDVFRITQHWTNFNHVHFERFSSPPPAAPTGAKAYKLNLARQGRTIEVHVGETMLNALRRSGVDAKAGCEGGTCGDCKTRYTSGIAKHADFVLSDSERASFIMPCVSGSLSEEITLDI